MKNMILTLISGLLVIGCGGGGSGGGSSSASEASPAVEESVLAIDELNIPEGFDYDTLQTLTLEINLSDYDSERSFVSVYHDYSEQSMTPVSTSKLVTSSLTNGQASLTFTVNESELPLIAKVIGLESGQSSQMVFEFTNSSELWVN